MNNYTITNITKSNCTIIIHFFEFHPSTFDNKRKYRLNINYIIAEKIWSKSDLLQNIKDWYSFWEQSEKDLKIYNEIKQKFPEYFI